MSKNLMYNRYSKGFHLSHNPFAFHKGSLPRFGETVALAHAVHALVTRKSMLKAVDKEAVSVPVVVTKWPRVKLALLVIKEAF